MSQVSLEDIYAELKNVSSKLESVEKTLETLIIMMLPEEEISEDELKEIEEAEAEIERGEYVPLEELLKEYGVE
jgi:predicted transcriptional regulator